MKPGHKCPDWDYLYIHPGDPEMEVCTCSFFNKVIRANREPREEQLILDTGDKVRYNGREGMIWGRSFGSRRDGQVRYDIYCDGIVYGDINFEELHPIKPFSIVREDD